MRCALRSTAFVAACFVLAFPRPSAALTKADLACQAAVGTAARAFAATKHKALVECNNVALAGKTCNQSRLAKRTLKAQDKLVRSVVAACRNVELGALGFPGFCFDPTFGDFTVGDLSECLQETHASVVDFVFVPVEYPTVSGLFGAELRCARTIGHAAQTFVAKKLRARAQCLDDRLRRRISDSVDCRAPVAPFGGGTGDSRTDGRIIAAEQLLASRLLDACAGVELENLGFPGFCFDGTGGAFDVEDLRSCVLSTHETIADQLIDIEYPPNGGGPDPTPSPLFPTPTPTSTPPGRCDFTTLTFTSEGGGLDVGWTGLMHNQPLVNGGQVSFDVNGCDNEIQPCGLCSFAGPVPNRNAGSGIIDNHRCAGDTTVRCATDDECGANGPCGYFFGSPLPLSAGGVSICALSRVDGAAAGSVDTDSGEASLSLPISARISVGEALERPCPTCDGDTFANDGQLQGACVGGARDGDPCDANGTSGVFTFGSTSFDCPPAPAATIASLSLPWDFTTGTVTRTLSASSPDCSGFGSTDRKCFCDAGAAGEPTRPNACLDDTATPEDESVCLTFFEDGICPSVPADATCAFDSFRGCLTNDDCPLFGDFCVVRPRPCFGDNGRIGGSVIAVGAPSPFFGDTSFPLLAALSCVAPVSSAAVNAAAGLPGLGRLETFGELRISTEAPPFCGDRHVDPGESCDPPGADACTGGVACSTDCSCALPTCESGERSLTLRTGEGDFDYGWTGIAHNQSVPADGRLPATLACTGDACSIASGTPVGGRLLPPLSLSSGGVSTCVVTTVRAPISGDYDCGSGCGTRDVPVRADVFLVQEAAEPCPVCIGDTTANDGAKSGFCNSGATPGAPCDANGATATFGTTSNDCLPAGSSVGELDLDLTLTTGASALSASLDCLSSAFPSGACHCPGQIQPNSCLPDGVCPASGVCEQGPIDGVCSTQSFRQCRSGTGSEDCEDIFPGAGTCVDVPRPCFGDTIQRVGQCGATSSTLTATFCMPATRAAAINTTAGLPGPAALTFPVETDGCRCDPGAP